MNSKQVIDIPEKETEVKENRVLKDVITLIGTFHLLAGLFFLYVFYVNISMLFERIQVLGYTLNDINWLSIFGMYSPSLIYSSFFLLAAIGLMRRKTVGWTVGVSISVFSALYPVFLILSVFLYSNGILGFPLWLAVLLFVIFGSITTLLLLKRTQALFAITRKNMRVAVILVTILVLHLFLVPLIR